jgi:GDP-4-dehydro-6-deoxy-D-mannose reductase
MPYSSDVKAEDLSYLGENDVARWLVLGAAGFVGRAAFSELKAHGHRTVGAGRSASRPAKINGDSWHLIDVCDAHNLRTLLRNLRPSILLNAIGHHPMAANSELRDFYVRSTTMILEAVQAEQPSCRVVLMGSAAEYGNSTNAGGSSETDACRPLSDYGRAKCEQFDVACRFAANGLAVSTARLFNLIGSGQGSHRFVGALLEQIRRGGRPVEVHSGNHVRDWIDVRDAARALIMLAESPKPPAVANICTGKGHTVEFVAGIVGRLAGVEVDVKPGEASPDFLWHSVGNTGRINNLGWRHQHELIESLTDQWRVFL